MVKNGSKGKKSYKKSNKKTIKKSTISLAVKKYVKKMVHVNEETKQQNFSDQTSLLTYNAAAFTLRTIDCNLVMSLITQGTGEGGRIGNKVAVQSLIVKGWLSVGQTFQTSVATTGPVIVKMFVGRLKQALTNPNLSTLYQRLYDNGNTSSTPQNNYFDVLRSVNRDLFMIYQTKTFKIGPAANNVFAPGTTVYNNDFKLLCPFSIQLNKHLNKLDYDDGVASPTNAAIYIWFVCVNADGTATNVAVPPLVNLCYDMEVLYKDA